MRHHNIIQNGGVVDFLLVLIELILLGVTAEVLGAKGDYVCVFPCYSHYNYRPQESISTL